MVHQYYLQRKTSRRVSRSAKYAPTCALFGLILLIVAAGAHRFGLIQQPDLVFIAVLAVFFALLALLLAMKSFYNLWRSGDAGGGRAVRGTVIALLTLAPLLFLGVQIYSTPKIADISTDLENPVQFNSVMGNQQGLLQAKIANSRLLWLQKLGLNDLIVGNGLDIQTMPDVLQQLSAYPEVSGRQYDSAHDHVQKAALKVLKDQGFHIIGTAGNTGEDMEITIEAIAKTPILGLRSDVAVRLRDETEQTAVDMRAVSRFGRYDLGFNANLIENFFNALDLEIRRAIPDAPEE